MCIADIRIAKQDLLTLDTLMGCPPISRLYCVRFLHANDAMHGNRGKGGGLALALDPDGDSMIVKH